ncbi:LolA family protein [Parvularcula lutaonensis]|uniref:Outer membrane lipoprotein carrier protein LolA n=1 Tax=Parvularcula lutaonensis TaxID=491923 RepID=A0ABV7M9K0_9PROT|nr:outer membrane lipoprotein carrier protein LolA [Parvularcula lutaonensis]
MSLPMVLFVAAMNTATAPAANPQDMLDPKVDMERRQSLLEAARSGLESIRALQAKFTQVAPSGTISTGTLYLQRPGRLRFEYDEPSPMLIVATGGLVYVQDKELQTTDSYPVGQTPLRFLLSKELDLEAAQVMSVEESRHGLKIVLAAKDKDLRGHLALLFEPENLNLAGWSFVDANGQVTLVNLEDVEQKKRLPGSLFRVPQSEGLFLSDN